MDRPELELCIAEAERATSRAQTLKLLDRLARHASAPWIDDPLAARIRSLFEKHGRTPPAIGNPNLRVGETWLLLAEAEDGHVTRLRARRRIEVSTAFEQLAVQALRGLDGTVARALRSLPTEPFGFEVEGEPATSNIHGTSHGLSACVAALSRALGQAPRFEVAGTASVDGEGRLRPVSGIVQKTAALRRAWPRVSTLVVARDQAIPEGAAEQLEVVRANDLAEALRAFGLDLGRLEEAPIEDYVVRAKTFEGENQRNHATERWLQLSNEARRVALALAEERPEESQQAFLCAARFATHAGAPEQAQELLDHVPEEVSARFPELGAQRLIYQASNAIETQPEQAVTIARKAIEACEALPRADRDRLLGQALGTCGRALMHTGKSEEAESLLQLGVAHHAQARRDERPRSCSYLATCLRRLGRTDEALAVAADALKQLETMGMSRVREMSKLYLLLERGRIHAAAGRDEDAVKDLSTVRAAQPETDAYPGLGAERSLVAPLTRLGRHEEARRHLEVCAQIAETAQTPNVARIGAIALGEELLAATPLLPRERLEPLWRKVFGDRAPAEVVAMWIY